MAGAGSGSLQLDSSLLPCWEIAWPASRGFGEGRWTLRKVDNTLSLLLAIHAGLSPFPLDQSCLGRNLSPIDVGTLAQSVLLQRVMSFPVSALALSFALVPPEWRYHRCEAGTCRRSRHKARMPNSFLVAERY